jgi:UDP-glucose-4-epimerase GalE
MHFAALTYVAESVTSPATYYRTNVGGSLALLEAMRATDVDQIVFSSSCATYAVREGAAPITEDHPQKPINPYGETKLTVERILRSYSDSYGLRAVALRYFNAAGADPEGEIGEAHDPETHLIPLILDAAAKGTRITILGDDYPTPDGTCVRDYVHVSDLADAHLLAWGYINRTPGFHAFNLGTGQGYSNMEILTAARRITGRQIDHEVGPRRSGDSPTLTADPTKALRELLWTPRRSSVADIVGSAWRWRRNLTSV